MLGDKRLQLGDDLALAGAAEVGLEAVLERLQAQLLQTLGLAPKGSRLQPGQGWAAPEGESVAQERRRPLAVSRAERLASLACDLLEPGQVELVAVEHERVAAAPAFDGPGLELTAEPRDVDLHGLLCCLRRLLPELFDEPLEWDRPSGPEDQGGEHALLAGTAERKRPAAAVDDLEGP